MSAKEMFKKLGYTLLGLVIGIIVTVLIIKVPKVRYDFNNDGIIDLKDMVILRNYILEH